MKVNPQIFRAYDLRGVVDVDLTNKFYVHLGKGYATFIKRHNIDTTVIVGRDARFTSEEYSRSLIEGIISEGVNVIDIGMTFIGNFYWSQYFLKHKGGIFITASHNPKNYNGAKISVDYSETMVSDQMQELRETIENEDYEATSTTLGTVTQIDILSDYTEDMKKRISVDKPLKVLVDTSYSTGGAVVPHVLKALGFEVVEKHTEVNHDFPLGAPDPTETDLAERLSKEVIETGADVGFSYDSDGDRIGIVDEKGTIIWNDMLVALFSVAILDMYPGSTIMFNSLCSLAVSETIVKNGGKPFMWRTGHSFLKKKNQEIGAAFIGELSGHFFFSRDFYNHDDGIYSTLRLLSYLAKTNEKLSDLISKLPHYYSSPEIKVGYPDDKKEQMINELSEKIRKDKPNARVFDDERIGDGVRFETDTSMFVVRYSQNGPYVTVKIESTTEEEYETLRRYIASLIKDYNDIDWNFGVSQELLKLE